ncbi:MAG: glycoside hydrolase, partial [Gammaproteobacteria bacterium]|nr:glycoside hydrolase [Gammaproteobacteria bacterium]
AFIDDIEPRDPNFDDGSSGDDDSSGDGSSHADDAPGEEQITEKYSELYVVPVTQCGSAVGTPVKVSGEKTDNRTNQGASLAIDPQTGAVVVVWRRFSHIDGQEDAILMSVSSDGGINWSSPITIRVVPEMLRPGDMSDVGGTFDQGSTGRSARTNAFPTVVITDSGQADVMGDIYVAWANRIERTPATGWPRESRIVITKSSDGGLSWLDPFPVDDAPLTGHQFQPTMHYQNGLLSLAYLDLRETHTRGVFELSVEKDPGDPGKDGVPDTEDDGKRVVIAEMREYTGERETVSTCEEPDCFRLPDERLAFTDYMIDAAPENPDPDYQPVYSEHLKRRHTLDLRMLQFEPFVIPPVDGLGESVKITNFPFGLRTRNGEQRLEQFQFTPPNFKMFAKGTKAFIGDYIHCGALGFITDGNDNWDFNTRSDVDPALHCAWTDNRNVRPGLHSSLPGATGASHSTEHYTPPGAGCDAGYAGTRNQDVFNSRITHGVYAGSFGNSRPLGYVTIDSDPEAPGDQPITFLLQRSYDVFVENMTNQTRHYRLTIENQPGNNPITDRASFEQFPKAPFENSDDAMQNPPLESLDVSIGPLSSASRAVFASSADAHAPILISIREISSAGGSLVADGHATRILLNPDSSNPAPRFPDNNIPATVQYSPQLIEVLDVDVDSAVRNKINFAPLRVAAPDPNNPDPTNPDPTNPDPT